MARDGKRASVEPMGYRPREVAEILGVTPQTVYRMMARRQIGYYKVRAAAVIPEKALADYLAANYHAAEA